MPKIAAEMSSLAVKRLGAGLHAVGGVSGLCLQVAETGARSWILRVWIGGSRQSIGLGPFPEVGLSSAREMARDMRASIRSGRDPLQERREARSALIRSQKQRLTFTEAFERFAIEKTAEFSNDRYKEQWRATIANYALPVVGDMLVQDIKLQDILNILTPIWTDKTETATKLRERVEKILTYAIVHGHRSEPNPAVWKGNLQAVLPSPARISKSRNFPAIAVADAKRWWHESQNRVGVSARALQFQALTASRTGLVRFASWDEIDLDAQVWTIQPGRQASKIPAAEDRPHRVPLSGQAMSLLVELPKFLHNPLIFVAPRKEGPLSDAALSKVLKTMHSLSEKRGEGGFVDPDTKMPAVPHGVRSMFRTWVSDYTEFPPEMAEIALGHKVGNKVARAYDRAAQLEKRREMMAAWANFLTGDQNDI